MENKKRKNMVDNLIRPANVTNPKLLLALEDVQRDKFLPSNLSSLSYSETDLLIQDDRISISPWLLAKMLQFLDVNLTDNVLSLATGFGYSCALLSSLVNFVVAVERHDLAQEAQNRLIENGMIIFWLKKAILAKGQKQKVLMMQF